MTVEAHVLQGSLAAALAKAQAKFGPVKRDKKVVVQKKTGGTYEFRYAPLDTVLDAVRQPLADNGLVVVQILDDGDLVTTLLHESGAAMSGRVALPNTNDMQGYGSAITYLRRYAIQALLGIAAEEDDDGNRALGNDIRMEPEPDILRDGLIGTVEKGRPPVDLELRQTPEGAAWGFKLKNGRKSYQVLARGQLAEALAVAATDLAPGTRVQVWGAVEMVPWSKDGKDMPPYPRVNISRLESPEWTLPAVEHAEAESIPLLPLDEDEKAAIGGGLPG